MRKTYIAVLAVLMLTVSCAKEQKSGANDSTKRHFDAWLSVNHPEAKYVNPGVYMLTDEEVIGKGEVLPDSTYAMVSFTTKLLDGTVVETTDEDVAKKLGLYDKTYYYGTEPWAFCPGYCTRGEYEVLRGMKVGGKRTVIVPAWLQSYDWHDTEEGYLAKSTNDNSLIYEVELIDYAEDLYDYQLELMREYSKENLGGIDTLSAGFFYKKLNLVKDTTSFPSDTTVYINYIGRLLNGQVFDTTIQDTAKVWGIYDSSREYAPVSIKWAEEMADITMEGSDVITGFKMTLWQMRAMEKGVGMFNSAMGYDSSGQGEIIPPYAPLIFEVELVPEPTN